MDKLRENVFQTMFAAGAIRFADVHIGADGWAMVVYQTMRGIQGVIHTKLGEPKQYKPETALRFLRQIGLASVKVEMAHWSPSGGQASLL